jgi:hypothetical protein
MGTFEWYFLLFCCIFFMIIGFFGNIVSIAIFLSKEFVKQPTTFYLISSLFLNLISLLYLPVMVFSEIWTTNTISCKILSGFTLILTETQSWVYVFCSVDRYITTALPAKLSFKNKQSFQIAVILSCLIILVGFCIPAVYSYEKFELKSSPSNETFNICISKLSWVRVYFQYQFLLLRVVIPFIITILANMGTIYTLCASKRRLGLSEWENMKKEVQLAKTLLLMDFLFILFRLPQVISTTINNNLATYLYSFNYSAFTLLGSVHNTFIFIIFIIFNRIYRKLFLRYIFCRK